MLTNNSSDVLRNKMIVLVDAYYLRTMKEQIRALFLWLVYKRGINCISIVSYKAGRNL